MDLILSRYGVSILDSDIEIGIELIPEAYKKRLDSKLWQCWLVDYARMDGKTFKSFEEYKKSLLNVPSNNSKKLFKVKTREEIFAQSEKIIAAWKKGGGSCGTV